MSSTTTPPQEASVAPGSAPDIVKPEDAAVDTKQEFVDVEAPRTVDRKAAEASGYSLTPTGLANMVKDNQVGFLQAYQGGDGLAAALDCDSAVGLTSNTDFEKKKKEFGCNYVDPPPVTPYMVLIWEGLHDATILMLMAAAIVSLILGLAYKPQDTHTPGPTPSPAPTIPGGSIIPTMAPTAHVGEEELHIEWIEGAAILVTVAIVLNVQAMTDWSKARQFRKQQMELENDKHVQLIRDGKDITIHPRELVVGDIMRIAVGDILPVDGVLLQGSEVNIDESALTGESCLIPKCPSNVMLQRSQEDIDACIKAGKDTPFLLSGTNVMSGSGKALVVAVGEHSLQGRILAQVSKSNEEVTSAMEHPAEDDAQEEAVQSRNCFMRCCAGCCRRVKSFFTFGQIDSGGTLMQKLDHLAIDIGKMGIIVAVLTFFVMVIRWSVDQFSNGGTWDSNVHIGQLLDFFITSVTILVVAIPEGLPLAVTLSLAISMRRMTFDNNLVKHMESCETMGSATTICSDKTGTLTQNRMTVMRVFIKDKTYKYSTETQTPVAQTIKKADEVTNDYVDLLSQAVALNTSSTSVVELNEDGTTWKYAGNATECALLKLCTQLGVDPISVRQNPKFADPAGKLDWGVHTIPFSSTRKKMSWVVQHPSGNGFRVFSKGAPSYIFDNCTTILNPDGTSTGEFTPQTRVICDNQVEAFQNDAMRTIAIAYRDFEAVPEGGWDAAAINESSDKADGDDAPVKAFEVESKLTLIGVVGIEDPLRPTVIDAIKQCNTAGVDVRMCTGDALATAIAISKQCGILRPKDLIANKDGDMVPKENFAMTGAEFDERVHFLDNSKKKVKRRCFVHATKDVGEMLQYPFIVDENGNKVINQKEFDLIWPKLRVLARCQPEDKLTLVRGIKNSKLFRANATCQRLENQHGIKIFPDYQVVAVTGDGTNDAPALKNADVGFAMGIVGTDIAKQACDIMLLDDNFASIVKAVMWGRNVYDSIAKFIQFQLTVNIVAISVAVVGAFAFTQSPLSALQMLWVNMIMDSLASIALATEPPTGILLERPPYGKRRPVISRVMAFNMLGQATYQLIWILVILFADPAWIPGNPPRYPPANRNDEGDLTLWTIVFNAFVQMQLFNQCNSRKLQTVERLRSKWVEWNVFVGITLNPIFIIVITIEGALQVVIVQFAGPYGFRLVENGLSGEQWAFCLAIGAGSLLWQFVVNAVILATDKYFLPEDQESEGVGMDGEDVITSLKHIDANVSKAKAVHHWNIVRSTFLYENVEVPTNRVAEEREDSWVTRGVARPFRNYQNTKQGQIQAERQISDTGRELLGLDGKGHEEHAQKPTSGAVGVETDGAAVATDDAAGPADKSEGEDATSN